MDHPVRHSWRSWSSKGGSGIDPIARFFNDISLAIHQDPTTLSSKPFQAHPCKWTGWRGMDIISLKQGSSPDRLKNHLHSLTAISPDYANRCRRKHHTSDRQITSHISSRRLVTINDGRFTSYLGRADTPAWSVT
jgi:hypothetical protein